MMLPEPKPKAGFLRKDYVFETPDKTIPDKKETRAKAAPGPNKKDIWDRILATMPDIIEGMQPKAFGSSLPKFKRKFVRFKPSRGPVQVFEVSRDEVVTLCGLDVVAQAICSWAHSLKKDERLFAAWSDLLDADKAAKAARSWLAAYVENAILEMPPPVRFKSEAGLCFHRLPFDLEERNVLEAPTWQEIFSRMSNAEAFAMRVASLLLPDTQRRQVVWLSGDANSGKSVVTGSIGRLLGDAFTSVESEPDSFWKSSLVGKRAVVMHEAKVNFLRTPLFKSITGDDMHLINDKGEKRFLARIDALFFMTSNDEPLVPRDQAVLSRIIHCAVAPIPPAVQRQSARVIEELLWKEMPALIGWAMHLYRQQVGLDGIIPHDASTLHSAADEYESAAMEFLAQHFVCEKGSLVTQTRMEEIMSRSGREPSQNERTEWKAAWKRKGITYEKKWIRGENQTRWAFCNIRVRNAGELPFSFETDLPHPPEPQV